jgi:hypothetical protein
MEQKVKIEFPQTADEGTKVLLIGEALTPREPAQLSFRGNIDAVDSFIRKRLGSAKPSTFQLINPNSVIEVSEEKKTIKLSTNPNDPFSSTITAVLEDHSDLKPWGINTTKTFKREEMVKLIKFSRMAFANSETYLKLLEAFQKFNAKTAAEHASENDNRGNRVQNFEKYVTSNLPEGFALTLPIFKGKPAETFFVELCQEVTDGGAHFWLESPELKNIQEEKALKYINEGLSAAIEYDILIMWQ